MNDLAQRAALKKSSDGGSSWPPSWETMPHGIRVGRYTDPAFAALEHEKLWGKVWQAAARLDEIPQVGDFTVYNIGDQSVMIVRADEQTIKAYHNVCPHRGTSLADVPQGCFENRHVICPFHGWRWDLHGNNEFVLERQEFRDGKLQNSDVGLREVHHVVFAGFIFINLDRNPEPFDDYIAPVREMLENLAIGEMRNYWWKALPIPSNWKVAQEAFFEGYHVPATHPQLEPHSADFIYKPTPDAKPDFNHWNVAYETWPRGHGRFYGKKTPMKGDVRTSVVGKATTDDMIEAMAARLNLLAVGMDAQVLAEDVEVVRSLKGKSIPEGSNLGAEYVKALYARAAEQQRPMPKPMPEVLGMWGGEIFVFPNLMILPQAGNAMIYRVRPDGNDPDKCIFEIMSTKTYPAATPVPRAVVQTVTDLSDPEQVLQIPRQDLGNIPRMQKGLHSKGIRQTWLAVEQEKIILNMHRELDRYLLAE
ncbi:aromatic ring-hydroxylating oxygenase subunit alpha [Solimonas terrae]|uniref:Aromatic ring-hydroxylating dioxygenase subunit alpha n=1 Tax=Solimonas terrae TaxID=1396819 RepID=A0A6M2BNM8_9GAMM|nr:aromatic ring-hydroxylating dioxygenase subunit alpha [Solimonas terrae]NGY04078.1 aromatic ring-hydroxylating dioxygenase subunit alpha [Solimonas terrae]